MTAFTRLSAVMNMPHGDRSWGSDSNAIALRAAGASGAACAAAAQGSKAHSAPPARRPMR